MKNKYFVLIILLLFICVTEISCGTQKNGYVVTNANDTISGKFKLAISSSAAFTVYTAQNAKTDIKINDIKNINIVKREKVAATYIISDNSFWQLLAAKGNIGIYKRNYIVCVSYDTIGYRYRYTDIAIFSDTTQIRDASIFRGGRSTQTNDMLFLQEVHDFLYVRYKLKLPLTFKDLHIDPMKDIYHQIKLFEFILDKEAALEQTQK